MAMYNGKDFPDQVTAGVQMAQAVIRTAPLYYMMIVVGAVLGFGKFIETFLAYLWFSYPMRDINGDLTFLNWVMAVALAVSLVVALTYAVHLLLRGLSARMSAQIGIAMGIFALIAVAANPWIISDQLSLIGGSSFDDPGATEPSTFMWLAEIARTPAYVIAALAAGFGVELMIKGVHGLRKIRQAKEDVTTGTDVLVRYQGKSAEAQKLPDLIESSRSDLRRSVAIVIADFAQREANRIGAYLNGTSISAEVVDDLIHRIIEPKNGEVDAEVLNIVNMLAPVPLNHEELPDARTLSEAARDELSDYSAFLREHYNAKTIMKELEVA